jgi:hypothetical protein
MRTIRIFLAALMAITIAPTCFGQNYNSMGLNKGEHDSTICLEINGRILKNSKGSNKVYKVELIENNEVIETVTKKDNKEFSFILKKDSYYAIKIHKAGYAPKLISICTKIPEARYNDRFYSFSFKTELFTIEESEKLDEESRDFPIAIVSFNKQKKGFDYNERYTSNIKKSLSADASARLK